MAGCTTCLSLWSGAVRQAQAPVEIYERECFKMFLVGVVVFVSLG